jgi:hypothetical protein
MPMRGLQKGPVILGVAFALGLSGCATTLPITSDALGALRAGVTEADAQARLSLEGANDIARGQALQRIAESDALTLKEADFPLAVAREDAAQWRAAFGVLDAYLGELQNLVDPARATATGDAIMALGNELRGGVIGAKLPASVQGLFAAFGEALIQARAEKNARDIMRATDRAFGQVMTGMADAVGRDASANLRGTVRRNLQTVADRASASFAEARASGLKARRKAAEDYLAAIDERDRQDAALQQLSDSLIALGEAHAAAAAGEPATVGFWVRRIAAFHDDARRRIAEARQAGDEE